MFICKDSFFFFLPAKKMLSVLNRKYFESNILGLLQIPPSLKKKKLHFFYCAVLVYVHVTANKNTKKKSIKKKKQTTPIGTMH